VALVLAVVLVGGVVLALRSRQRSRAAGTAVVLALVVPVALLALVGVRGGGAGDAGDEPPRVAILAPLDSTSVASPVAVEVTGDRLGRRHLHLAVDAPCLAEGAVIPVDGAHRHLGDGEWRLALDLAPGEHTLCLQAGDPGHRAGFGTDEVTVLVRPKETP